jgi:hypothetical protein
LQCNIGLLVLSTPPHLLPAGSTVTMTLLAEPQTPTAAAPVEIRRQMPELVARIVDLLRPLDGKLADRVLAQLPAPGPKLAAQLAAIGQSVESDGLRRWLGDAVTLQDRTAPAAFAEFGRQWEGLAQPVQGPAGGDWQSLVIPLLLGATLANLRLTSRRRGQSAADRAREREQGTRFLVDLELSGLGELQLDGLVKREQKRFDLILRSRESLPGAMRRDIDALFVNSLSSFGMQGGVSFHTGGFIATPPLIVTDNGIIFA